MPEVKVAFDDAAAYERVMGRWSGAVGVRFLDWLAPTSGLRWLDVGCGTGAFTELVLKRCAPGSIVGVDPAPAQIDYARQQIPAAEFRTADATALPFADGEFDIVASALVINFIPDRIKALAEMRRVLRQGGIVTAYLWHRSTTANDAPFAPIERGLETIGANVLRPPMRPGGGANGIGNCRLFRHRHHHTRSNPHVPEFRGLLGNTLFANRATGTINRRAERR